MKKASLILPFLLVAILSASNLHAEDPFKNMDQDFDSQMQELDKKFEEQSQWMDQQWEAAGKQQEAMWAQFEAEVKRKWEMFVHSTKKDWVDYSEDKDSRSKVDFKRGKIEIEVIVPEDDPQPMQKAKEKIQKQAETVFNKKDTKQKRILEKQIVDKKGSKVVPKDLKKYLKKEVLPKVKPAPKPFKSRDGVKRRKYSVTINMVPEHLRIRAEKYLPVVRKNAKRFHIKPQLILAVIHTESYFNPKAVSSSKAIGIMQIIPRYAGREAYSAIYGVDKLLSWEYLFIPGNNIELGTKYLSLLRYKHFQDVPGELKNRYVSIGGYNWGPTVMRKKIVSRYPIAQMSDDEVFSLLRQKTPEETRNYIERVSDRMPLYDGLF